MSYLVEVPDKPKKQFKDFEEAKEYLDSLNK
jgi:hypothetical protein